MNSPGLRTETSHADGLLRIALVGEIDLACEEDVVSTVAAAIAESKPSEVVLDLRRVTFMDSSGLRAVLRCRKITEDGQIGFRVGVVDGPVTRLFTVAGVSDWFEHE